MNENLLQYVKPELLILVPVLYILGRGLKASAVKNRFIPAILGTAGIFMSLLWCIGTSSFNDGLSPVVLCVFIAVTQGILAAGASVYANELIKHLFKQ